MTGSGKTTLAARPAGVLGLECHSVDDLTWEPGRGETPDAVPRVRLRSARETDAWLAGLATDGRRH